MAGRDLPLRRNYGPARRPGHIVAGAKTPGGKQRKTGGSRKRFRANLRDTCARGAPPVTSVRRKSVTLRGILRPAFVPKPVRLPKNLNPDCLNDGVPGYRLATWLDKVRKQRHVFLGYCSGARVTAARIRLFMERLGMSVVDWTNFQPAGVVYTRIAEAAAQTACGVFLFTKDDDTSDPGVRAPRDNVVFEAGYFAAAKGKENTLIILEAGARMPSDLGGEIFILLRDRNKTGDIHTQLRECLEKML
jgi:hypothetical protein